MYGEEATYPGVLGGHIYPGREYPGGVYQGGRYPLREARMAHIRPKQEKRRLEWPIFSPKREKRRLEWPIFSLKQ